MRYQGDTTHNHGFESASSAEEDKCEQTGHLSNNIREVGVAATADKEHIQKMTTQNNDLLKVVASTTSAIKQNRGCTRNGCERNTW